MEEGIKARFFVDIKPVYAFKGLIPGALALGQTPGIDLDVLYSLFKGLSSLQVLNELCVSNCSPGLLAQGLVLLEQGFHFCDQTGLDHLSDACIDALAFQFFGAAQAQDGPGMARFHRVKLRLKAGNGLSAYLKDLMCAYDPTRVIGADALSSHRINLQKLSVEHHRPLVIGPVLQSLTQGFIRTGAVKEPIQQGPF